MLSKINTSWDNADEMPITCRLRGGRVRFPMTARSIRSLVLLAVLAGAGLLSDFAGAETLTVVQQPVADEKAVFATVESISVVPARGRIGGTVVQLNVREGDAV